MEKLKVLFVCKGNVYRSAVAEQLFNKLVVAERLDDRLEAFSRGLQGFRGTAKPQFSNLRYYSAAWSGARGVFREMGISLEGHIATPLSEYDFNSAKIVLAADSEVRDALFGFFPDSCQNVFSFGEFGEDIADPAEMADPLGHRETILSIQRGVRSFFRFVVKENDLDR